MKKYTMFILLLAVIAALGSVYMFGQATASGSIQGVVNDKTQAVILGAEVTATNKATGAKRIATTNDTGFYRFDLLPVGTYTVRISKSGFASYAQTFELLVGQTVSIDATLNPGAASETVEVTSTAPLVDMAKTSVSQSITPSEVQEVPMLARDAANLAYLAPGVKATDSYDPTKNRSAVLSVNGQGGRNVNVTVNGVDNKDSTVGGTVMQLPLEAVQEFVISTQRFSAANGKSEGAAINMVTKSGTNQFHGSGFGFFRDQALNATDHFSKLAKTKAPYSRQQFGGSIGGPFKKDKAFGFFAIERQREHTSLSEDSDAFTELLLAKPIGAQPAASIPTPFFDWRYNGRGDYRFNDRHSMYVSYTSQSNKGQNDQSDGLGDLTGGNDTTNQLQIANFTLSSVLSQTVVNTFTFGYQYWNNKILSNINKPYVTFASGAWFGTNVNVPQQSIQRKWQFRDDLTKTAGNHTLKMGVDYVWQPTLGGFFASNSTLEIDFNLDPSEIVALPAGFATAGIVNGMSQSVGNPRQDVPGGTKQIGLYFQDDWKMTKRLTVNLGLRWDKDINLLGQSSILASRTYQEMKAIKHPLTDKLPQDDNKDFSPRVGFAYDLTGGGKHVLRGGFGLYYGNVFQNIPLFMQQQANAFIYQGVFSIQGDDTVPGVGIPLSSWRYGVDPFPTVPAPQSALLPGSTGRLMDPNYRNPYTEQFNFGYQWAVSPTSVFEAEYVHSLSLHENKTININPTVRACPSCSGVRPLSAAFAAAGVPVLGRIAVETSTNRSRYDGVNFSYRHRMTKWYQITANYTLSHAVGWVVGSPGTSFRNYSHDPLNPFASDNFGPTPDDERHHLTFASIIKLPYGFQVAPVMQIGSARPFNLSEGYDVLGLGSGQLQALVVNNSSPTDYTAYKSSSQGVAARTCLAAGQCHVVPYNSLRGDAFFQLDTRISKNWKFGEKAKLETMFQMFNLTNKTNFGSNYNGTASSKSFLTPNGYIAPSNTTIPRAFVGEFGFRFTF
jgi:Carboxypeptidase regulatory-like domain/TonB dependent receptor